MLISIYKDRSYTSHPDEWDITEGELNIKKSNYHEKKFHILAVHETYNSKDYTGYDREVSVVLSQDEANIFYNALRHFINKINNVETINPEIHLSHSNLDDVISELDEKIKMTMFNVSQAIEYSKY